MKKIVKNQHFMPLKKLLCSLFILANLFNPFQGIAQDSILARDSAEVLSEVVVRGFSQNRKMFEVPAAVSMVDQRKIGRFNSSGIVAVINAQAGTRLEERSPGSYRLNIRGSSLRSPFGVRNVKIYYNDIPYTDPGGNTYLSMIGFYSINRMEIWKGPASSMYGAGTGGVMILETSDEKDNQLRTDIHGGSDGLVHYQVKARYADSNFIQQLSYQHLKSDGYREHTNMERKVLTWDGNASMDKGELHAHILYGDLYYQTPGALNAAQYAINRKAARPAAGPFPSADESRSAFNIRTFLAGLNYTRHITEQWDLSSTVYGAFSKVKNPTIRNYEIRNEPHAGARITSTLSGKGRVNWKWVMGGELQQGNATIRIADNDKGVPAALQTEDEADLLQYFLFSQLNLDFGRNWILDAGLSWNRSTVAITRLSELPVKTYERKYRNELAPRVSLLKKLNPRQSLYVTVSRGFSPPTTAEILPSTGIIATTLEAESGINYELGWKSSWWNQRLNFNIAGYYFKLNNTIAQRRDSAGADYFVNAGATKQLGIEAEIEAALVRRSYGFIRSINAWGSYTLSDFSYQDYIKDDVDLGGKELPGIAPNVMSLGLDIITAPGWYSNLNMYYSDRMYLNDANTVKADPYKVITAKFGYRKNISSRLQVDVNAVVANLFNEEYVSGYDINAVGGRYYNASAGRNWMVGGSVVYVFGKRKTEYGKRKEY